MAEEKGDKTLADMDAVIVGARHDLTVAELRLVSVSGVEAASKVTGTAALEVRRAMKDAN